MLCILPEYKKNTCFKLGDGIFFIYFLLLFSQTHFFSPLYLLISFSFTVTPGAYENSWVGIASKTELQPTPQLQQYNMGPLIHCCRVGIQLMPPQRRAGSLTHCTTARTLEMAFIAALTFKALKEYKKKYKKKINSLMEK